MLLLIIIFAVGAVALGAWSASTSVELRADARRSMRAMDDYETVNVRDQEMLERLSDRVVAPVGRKALEIANKFTPVGYVENLKRKIVHAGNPPGYESDRFLIFKVLGVASCLLWLAFGILLFSDSMLLLVMFVGFMCAISVFGPDLVLQRKIEDRRKEIERKLPDTLDLLVISVEAGLGFEQALDRTAETVPGPLSDELRRMLQETRMGASRADALRALDERTDVEDLRVFIVAMLQADTFGVSVARILHTQADEIRERRRQKVQERSQKLPVKMLFPMVLCIFPATLVVVLLPGLLQVFEQL